MTQWRLDRTYRSTSGEVRWTALGEEGAPPLVLLHGTPFSSYVWRGVARALSARFRVYVWDMPGYGASEKAAGQDVSLPRQAEVFTELLAHWGLGDREPTVVAHDFGGYVALRAHLVHGARYRRLALVDAVALTGWGSPTYRLLGSHSDVFAQLPAGLHRALVTEYISSGSHPGLHPAVLEQLVEPWCTEEGRPAFYRQIQQNGLDTTADLDGRYGEIAVPTLVCWGAQDTWLPVTWAHGLVSAIPGARLRLFEGAGHLVQEDAPAELATALAAFAA
ncbi:alpha/beta hydrolase [Streptomyces sp. CB02923]|uniref:alpha/beta fold hydrolase n=1 Tax=Streptomyces sp. CB02923 TaxID=1718985 RepID=UPI00093AA0FE|nr:alpha/beta hydrolase [Streptomyces sp. CB02923]OKI09200.1 alpha/beta hydrolase [Streptomyces sp. CB02923]